MVDNNVRANIEINRFDWVKFVGARRIVLLAALKLVHLTIKIFNQLI